MVIYIPEDLVFEILTKLPVNSVLRFKCVCISWYNIIKNPNFITQQYNHDNNKTHLLVQHYKCDLANAVFTLFRDGDLSKRQDLYYPDRPSLIIYAAGPVNGLFLLQYNSRDPCIWNPATRESRPLTKLNPNFPRHIIPWCDALGFGVDPLTNDYKLIMVEFHWNKNAPFDPALVIPFVGVYNLVTDSWNRLDAKIPPGLYFKDSSVYLHGHHYWLSDFRCRPAIIAFDIRNDVFREIQAPTGSLICSRLSISCDNIAVFSRSTWPTYNFWVMEVEGYWTIRFSFENQCESYYPIKLWKDDELFFRKYSSDMVLYNTSTRETTDLGIQEYLFGGIYTYKESLASVNSGSKKFELRGLETNNLGVQESQIGSIIEDKESFVSDNSGSTKSELRGLETINLGVQESQTGSIVQDKENLVSDNSGSTKSKLPGLETNNLEVQESQIGSIIQDEKSSGSKKSEVRGLYRITVDFFIDKALRIWIWLKSWRNEVSEKIAEVLLLRKNRCSTVSYA